MQLQSASNPTWANPEHTAINLTIRWQGWAEDLPFTARADDVESHGRAIYEAAAQGDFGVVAAFVAPTVQPPTIPDFDRALSAHLDAVAQQRRYDNRISCAVRAGYPGPFQAEGQAFAAWMDACNAQAYTLLAEVQAGTRPLPTTTQALIDLLPPMVWPA